MTGNIEVTITLKDDVKELMDLCKDVDELRDMVPESMQSKAQAVCNRIAERIKRALKLDQETKDKNCATCQYAKVCRAVSLFEQALAELARIQREGGNGAWTGDPAADPPVLLPIHAVEATVFRSVAEHCPLYQEVPNEV